MALAAMPLLAACTAEETTAMIEDPGAFTCREEAVSRRNVSFEETTADLLSSDIAGTRTYNVTAKGRVNRCVVDSDGIIIQFHTI